MSVVEGQGSVHSRVRPLRAKDKCPHGLTYAKCSESWCQARLEDAERTFTDFEGREFGAAASITDLEKRERRAKTLTPKPDPEYLAALAATDVAIQSTVWHEEFGTPPWPLGRQWPVGTAYCPRCMKWWSGHRPSHCTVCHETFGSDTAGDGHRYGAYDPPSARRCRTREWMRGKGWWQDDHGIWRLPKPTTNPFQKGN